MRPTALFRVYRILSVIAMPFAARRAVSKLRKAGVTPYRAHERLGHATQSRPLGKLIWLHGASVGEAKSVLPLMAHLARTAPDLHLLLTSGTATSAEAVAHSIPRSAIHQFGPLDGVGPVGRFLTHWRPDLCVLIESELWPNLLDACARRDVPVALVNARLSAKSAQGWQKFPATARYVLRAIRMAHCQDRPTRDRLHAMGLKMAQQGQNLKSIIAPARLDAAAIDTAHTALNGRPIWVASSTHPGEEEGVLSAHKVLLSAHPNLCLILVPRHPERAEELSRLTRDADLSLSQRSTGGTLSDGAQVYLADTIGETDLWYAISPIVFLGGSWTDVGGHTPFEPAAAHTAILHGPNYTNFSEAYAAFQRQDASIEVSDGTDLVNAVATLLTHPIRAAQLAKNALPLVQSSDAVLNETAAQLLSFSKTKKTGFHG